MRNDAASVAAAVHDPVVVLFASGDGGRPVVHRNAAAAAAAALLRVRRAAFDGRRVPGRRGADENALRELGRAFRWHKSFPKGANVNFYELTAPDTFYERTFERGVEDFTYACGTGTASTAAVLTLRGLASGENVRADMRGGTLYMDVERDGNQVTGLYLTGPTNIVAVGEVRDEDLIS